jgi:hypothetical protein
MVRKCACACSKENRGTARLPSGERLGLTALLRVAYVDARYRFGFEVSREDLEVLARYVGAFRARAERACREQLANLAAAARAAAGGNS